MVCQSFPPAPYQVCGAILDKYNQMGGPSSFLLLPKSNELDNPGNTGKRSEFLGGNIYWSSSTGAHPVAHDFLTKFGQYGYEAGFLGYPTTDEIVLPDGVGRRQEFKGATIYWSPLSGAHNVQGAVRQKWIDLGAERGSLGYPITDEIVTPDGLGRMNRFRNGVIYWTSGSGAHPVAGRILDLWSRAGYEKSQWGYPTGDPAGVAGEPGAQVQKFQRGSIYVSGDVIRGLVVPAVGFTSLDTTLHPGYPAVDLSDYGTESDPTGSKTEQNTSGYIEVRAYFKSQGRPTAAQLWDHYYDNSGTDYVLDESTINTWTSENSTNYPDHPQPPANLVAANREDAIQRAINEAKSTGQPAKQIVSTAWLVTAGVSNDHVQSLGRYSLCSTTAAICKSGGQGPYQIELRQQTHIYDIYDYAAGDDYGNPAQLAVQIAVKGEKLGIAKPFLVYGSGSQQSWSGVR